MMDRRTMLALGATAGAAAALGPAVAARADDRTRKLTVWLTQQHMQKLKHRLAKSDQPQASASARLLAGVRAKDLTRAADDTPVQPEFYVGPYYETPPELLDLSYRFRGDAHAAYRLALQATLESDRQLAAASRSLILRWSALTDLSTDDDTPLVWSNQFPEFCFAAELLRRTSSVWNRADEATFTDLIRRGAILDTSARTNNWGSWGVVLRMATASYVGDLVGLESATDRWRELFDSQFDERGWQPAEITRNNGTGNRGICYSHFNLHPLTIAAQMALINGIDLFGHRNPSGVGIGDAFRVLMRWTKDPTEFSRDTGLWPETYEAYRANGSPPSYNYGYGEILQQHFPDPVFVELATVDRPLSFNWAGSLLTFTHGQGLA